MFFAAPFNPKTDIPSQGGKVILITGANGGIGKESLRYFATHGGSDVKLYLGARTPSKAQDAIKEIEAEVPGSKIHFLELDLASLASVKKAADTFKAENTQLDILMNNAGVMALPPDLTKDGYEIQFGTNVMGHFLLTRELLPLLQKTAEGGKDVRIINLSSVGHNFAPKGGFIPEQAVTDMASFSTWARYGQSKLGNILLTKELTKRYPEITSVSIHPGGVNTNLSNTFIKGHPWINAALGWTRSVFLTTPADGALNQTWAAVAPVEGKADANAKGKKVVPGAYYTPVTKLGGESSYAKDPALASKLWDWAEKEVVSKGY